MPELIAYHEAGHALMAHLLGGQIQLVTIAPDDDDGPRRSGDAQIVWRRSRMSDREFAAKSVQVHLAGPVAEMIYSGEPYHPAFIAEWSADWEGALAAAEVLFPDEQKRMTYVELAVAVLHRQLQGDDLWPALAALADNLLAHETLDREQVEEVLQHLL
jgi:ATP-dependent Zn protease